VRSESPTREHGYPEEDQEHRPHHAPIRWILQTKADQDRSQGQVPADLSAVYRANGPNDDLEQDDPTCAEENQRPYADRRSTIPRRALQAPGQTIQLANVTRQADQPDPDENEGRDHSS